ncbi:IS21 family transposase [Pseudonocardia sp.]|uniref:IS21 family transposase n=1 Tax=Pseudonocardia sp. TaxID=60912 RepID=UPI00263802A7|nr:IS21 family transposase [Pseudonocardia sp.]
MGSRVELYAAIRFDSQRNQMSIRALADKYGVHRRTVREAVGSPIPPPRRTSPRPVPVLDAVRELIDAMLVADRAAPRKQRHTAKRIHERLRTEHDAAVSYSYVAKYVHRRRPQLAAQAAAREGARAGVVAGFVPQCHPPGAEAEVDFADLWVRLAGEMTKCFLFTLRLSHSGKAVHRVFASQGQEAFLEGHVAAFEVLDGIPFDKIRYDNLRSAVHRVLFGRNRAESGRWLAFRAHYGFDAFYCLPGQEGAHEKGGVEGDGGRFRRAHLVPVPEVDTLAELNARLVAADLVEDDRHIDGRAVSVGTAFTAEAPLLRALPAERFDTALSLTARVDRYAQIMVRQVRYSVPARLIGSRVRVALSASELVVFDGPARVATHPRVLCRGGAVLQLDHYLEILLGKPGALPGSTALAQARKAGTFTATHEAFWAAARNKHGDAAGTRALIEVLLLHRRLRRDAVLAGIAAALGAGSVAADVVAIEARKHAAADSAMNEPTAPQRSGLQRSRAAVVTLGARRQAALPTDARPAPSVRDYDQLLTRRRSSPPTGGPDGADTAAGETRSS